MNELVKEIFSSIKKNKLRTALTGFSVAWGIFMLMILLGSGNGLENGIRSNFEGRNLNTVSIFPNYTTIPYGGYKRDRAIRLKLEDVEYLKKRIPNASDCTATIYKYPCIVRSGENSLSSQVTGITPSYFRLESYKIESGRNITQADIDNNRKVAVIGEYSREVFFGENTSIIDKDIIIDGVVYKVIGEATGWGTGNRVKVFIPITTQIAMYRDEYISNIDIEVTGIETIAQSNALEKQIKDLLAEKHHFSKDDRGGVWINSSIAGHIETQLIFTTINAFLWIIGLGTLFIGIVGVSNIMIVTVKERTFEFGIRKSMGATPASLIKMVLLESTAITSLFGYIGLASGAIVMKIVSYVLEINSTNKENASGLASLETFSDPTVDMRSAIAATIVLIIAGIIAGYIPARRASKLKTIDAMRYNK